MPITVILHGYSDDSRSFRPLAAFLKANRIPAVPIRLGEYITLEDTITVPDLAKAFEKALRIRKIPTGPGQINLVVHSTGALVAREWMTRFYLEQNRPCPVAKYLMLAPANFGSPLAAMGKTMFGRIVKGWKSGFESGTQVLNALEMGSSYSWQLARRDLFGSQSFYRDDECQSAVLVGSKPYQKGLRRLVDHKGSDGTVYVCTANLNAGGMTLRFGGSDDETKVESWRRSAGNIAFGVLPDRDHASIIRPDRGQPDLGRLILEFLKQPRTQYGSFRQECAALTATTLPDRPTADIFHTYQNLAVRVRDDLGNAVPDFFLEFYERAESPREENQVDDLMIQIHREVLETVHVFGPDPSHRSLLFDLTDLPAVLGNRHLMFSLSAAPLSSVISYRSGAKVNDVSELAVEGAIRNRFWTPNQTLLADLVIQREQADKVFRISEPV